LEAIEAMEAMESMKAIEAVGMRAIEVNNKWLLDFALCERGGEKIEPLEYGSINHDVEFIKICRLKYTGAFKYNKVREYT
jgi:hypothetical protein